MGGETTLRMTTNAPVSHIHNERMFRLETPIAMFLGPDEGFDNDVGGSAARMLRETQESWRAPFPMYGARASCIYRRSIPI